MLRATLEDLDTQKNNLKTMADAWAKGETETLEKLLLASMKTFNRIRMGISRPQPGVVISDYVLSNFPKAEREKLAAMIEQQGVDGRFCSRPDLSDASGCKGDYVRKVDAWQGRGFPFYELW